MVSLVSLTNGFASAVVDEPGLVEQALRVHNGPCAEGTPWLNLPGVEQRAVEDFHASHLAALADQGAGDRGSEPLDSRYRGHCPTAPVQYHGDDFYAGSSSLSAAKLAESDDEASKLRISFDTTPCPWELTKCTRGVRPLRTSHR